MTTVLIIILIALILTVFYIVSLKGQRDTDMSRFKNFRFAHRGLYTPDVIPENSMAAFKAALDNGYGIELDVHLTKDGTLAVIHDSSLLRTTGVDRKITDLTKEELGMYYLENTSETIPELTKVLELFDGQAPLIIELKSDGDNYAQLCSGVCYALKDYKGAYCLESFDPRCIRWLRRKRPDIIRGQLSENFLKHKDIKKLAFNLFITSMCFNFLTKPDFIAYRFSDRFSLPYRICTRLWKIQGVVWTVKSKAELAECDVREEISIFEGFIP